MHFRPNRSLRLTAAVMVVGLAGSRPADTRLEPHRALDSDETVLRRLNEEYVASFVHSDSAHYDQLLAEDFRAITPSGRVLDRASFLAAAAAPSGMTSFAAADVTVQIIGEVGIVQAHTPYQRLDGTTGDSRYTDVWVKREGTWRTLLAQVTPIRMP